MSPHVLTNQLTQGIAVAVPLVASFPSLPFLPRFSLSFHSLTSLSSPSSTLSKFSYAGKIQCTNNNKQQEQSQTTQNYDPKSGVAAYKPRSYEVLVADAANALAFALQDGKIRLEIDFPPLPGNFSSYKGSSDEFIDANIQLALAVIRKLQEKRETRACIVFPDKPEKRRASEIFKTALDSIDGISICSLDDVPSGPVTTFFKSVRNTLDFDFEDGNEGRWQSNEPPSLYVFINCSTRELSAVENGALFRQYPGPWQVMLKQVDGSYACVAESATRFTLGETKEELLRVLGLQEEQGSSLEFLRRGYKSSTWWEEDVELETSSEWRS